MVFENYDPKKCMQYKTSRDQRKTERAQGLNDRGTMAFENTGCYECDGFDENCPKKITLEDLQ